jgi:hypothetical protein
MTLTTWIMILWVIIVARFLAMSYTRRGSK